ncbi:hypothetical protein ACR5MH_0780 (plasmid) [Streptomyces sp. L7]|uniref:hypothetical protein n=1 Tax=Streptomyces sp. L7 TaxID=3423954 RepID=UPI000E20BEB8|nr:hypothetical protein DOE76_14460 [Leifsonia sp. ku-ls]
MTNTSTPATQVTRREVVALRRIVVAARRTRSTRQRVFRASYAAIILAEIITLAIGATSFIDFIHTGDPAAAQSTRTALLVALGTFLFILPAVAYIDLMTERSPRRRS